MPISYITALATTRMTSTRDYFADGSLELLAADNTLVATYGLSLTGGTVSGRVWTLALDATTVAAVAEKTITKAQLKTSAGVAAGTGLTVGLAGSGADIILNAVAATVGLNITIASATITHSA